MWVTQNCTHLDSDGQDGVWQADNVLQRRVVTLVILQ